MRTGQSFFIFSQDSNSNSIDVGIQWLQSQQCKEKMVVFCSINNAKNISCSTTAKRFFDELVKNRTTTTSCGKITLATGRNLPPFFNGAVLAIHLPDDALEKIDAISGSFNVFFVPWLATDGKAWKTRWGATDVSTGQKYTFVAIDATSELNSILHSSCAPNIHHPNDYNRIIDTLKALHQSGNMPSPTVISEFLKKHNWDFESADSVAEIATKIAARRIVKKR